MGRVINLADRQTSFGAYAPDPDADYRRGFEAGLERGRAEGRAAAEAEAGMVRWDPRPGDRGHGRTGVWITGILIALILAAGVAGALS